MKNCLSKTQLKLLEDSGWVVSSVLKAQGLQTDDDLRSLANLYLCELVKRFDPSKNVKWTTYAYKSIYLFVKTRHAQAIVEQNKFASEGALYLVKDNVDYEENTINGILIGQIRENLTGIDLQIFDLKLQDYSLKDMCEILNTSRTTIRNHWIKIKEFAKTIITNV